VRVTYEEHPELLGYVPTEGMPHRRRMRRIMRVVVLVAVAALILPAILGTWAVAGRSAASACAALVARVDSGAVGSVAAFDWFGASGPQWYCSAVEYGGRERPIGAVGVIPYG
jgi:cytochrome oxidase assembly protein ShyY1